MHYVFMYILCICEYGQMCISWLLLLLCHKMFGPLASERLAFSSVKGPPAEYIRPIELRPLLLSKAVQIALPCNDFP